MPVITMTTSRTYAGAGACTGVFSVPYLYCRIK